MSSEPGVTGIGGIQQPEEAYALRADLGIVDVGDFDGRPGIDPVKAIYAGLGSSCALLTNGDVRCWGDNVAGELGYGDPKLIGPIGDETSPGDEYRRLNQPSVLFTP
jgi:hypothetical protein